MSWWWAGAVGAARKKLDEGATPAAKFQSVGLIIGDTTVIGNSLADILPLSDTPGGPWKVLGLSSQTKPSPSEPPTLGSFDHIVCDLADGAQLRETLSSLAPEVTHLFYALPELYDVAIFRTVLDALLPSSPGLQHICLLTGRAHYLGPRKAHDPPFREDLPRLDDRNPFYDLEDILNEAIGGRGGAVTWSVHRPGIPFGFDYNGRRNLMGSLCVYAAICKKEGTPLRWPGNRVQWEGYSDASDADLVAEHQIWAAVDPYAKNESFNCSNGDVFKWKFMWRVLAEQFGVEFVGFDANGEGIKLAEAMKGKEGVWAEIAKENGLAGEKLEEVADWGFVDGVLNAEETHLDCMNKSKEHGFLGFRNSVASFVSWIDKAKAFKIVPP